MNIRATLLQLRAEIDAALAELPAESPQLASARFMKVADFAAAHNYSTRTVRDYCELGMPHQGEGRARRVLVAEAETWIASGGPRKARASRKGEAA